METARNMQENTSYPKNEENLKNYIAVTTSTLLKKLNLTAKC